MEAKELENISEVRSFFWPCSRRFIPQFDFVRTSETANLKRQNSFWASTKRKAFNVQKDGLVKAGALVDFDKDVPIKVIATASPAGIGVV